MVNGAKHFISTGKEADFYTVAVNTNPSRGARGISLLVIEKGTEGFSFGKKEEKMGIRSNPTYELIFENVRVPKENLLGSEGRGPRCPRGWLSARGRFQKSVRTSG